MTVKEARKKALLMIWGMASYFHEGIENGELSDNLQGEVDMGWISEEDAHLVQKWMKHEADIIHRKSQKFNP